MSDLQAATRKFPADVHDAEAVTSRLDGMRSNYAGQTRYETAIFVALLDGEAARPEASLPC